ncbi:MAG TPA: Ppx/GppA phosphatase family protein [Solirubrobacteraceae bacterium]|nr:Ppx/GppA phosphatase family protein [Solirubrobacteraceae bacterium]
MPPPDGDSRLAVADLGSNSFRLVVFTSHAGAPGGLGGWWKRTDEIYEPVRIGAGMEDTGELGEDGIARAIAATTVFSHFCQAAGLTAGEIDAVATSAIREASNSAAFLERAKDASGLDVRVLTREEEARYGYLAAINSTDLRDGAVLDLGGGSMQLVHVAERLPLAFESWRLGAVRMTERFLPGEEAQGARALARLRDHVRRKLERADWLAGCGERLVGVGGTVRNLAAAAQRMDELPEFGVQGFRIDRGALDELVRRLAAMPVSERRRVPGIKPARGDIVLAGAVVVQTVLETGAMDAIEATEAGLREGVFFERVLDGPDHLFEDVRRASVVNLAAQYDPHAAHTRHVAALALGLFDQLAAAGLHPGDPAERELLWAACLLHDVGVAVDYDDHHKHSRYLILNAGLPGFTPREVALIGQMVRYHRKGLPDLGPFEALARPGDAELLDRCAVLLRLGEDLERSRDQLVREVRAVDGPEVVQLELVADGDATVPRWAASREVELFARAFGRRLEVR